MRRKVSRTYLVSFFGLVDFLVMARWHKHFPGIICGLWASVDQSTCFQLCVDDHHGECNACLSDWFRVVLFACPYPRRCNLPRCEAVACLYLVASSMWPCSESFLMPGISASLDDCFLSVLACFRHTKQFNVWRTRSIVNDCCVGLVFWGWSRFVLHVLDFWYSSALSAWLKSRRNWE